MPRRFTDTDKWKKKWFYDLSPEYKALWGYLTDNCTHAGIWEVNWDLASSCVGTRFNPKKIETVFQKQFIPLDGGRRWFLVDFISFQYPKGLNPGNNAHKGVIPILQHYHLLNPDLSISIPGKENYGSKEDQGWPKPGAQVMVMDMVKKGGLGGKRFDQFWEAYPRKVGKGGARKMFVGISGVEVKVMVDAIRAQTTERQTKARYGVFCPDWKHPKTWLNQECWTDQVMTEIEIAQLSKPRRGDPQPAQTVRPPKSWTCEYCGQTMMETLRDSHIGPACPKWTPLSDDTRRELKEGLTQLAGGMSAKKPFSPPDKDAKVHRSVS